LTSIKLKIFADGGSRGNPGPAASGYVIKDESDQILEEGGVYLGITTNNQAEYGAVKLALEKAKRFNPDDIEFYLDSQLVVNQLNGVYKVKHAELKPVVEAVKQLAAGFGQVTYQHIPREQNQLADKQVNIVLDSQSHL
jgi:ribonuclease HI